MALRLSMILIFLFLVLALGPLALVAALDSCQAQARLTREIATQLRSIADSRARELESYIADKKKEATLLARSPNVVAALETLGTAFKKDGLNSQAYREVDATIRPYLSYQLEPTRQRDVLLLSLAGDVVFSVAREKDLGTNVKTGPYKDTSLARAFENASTLLETEVSEFAYYAPSDEVAAFLLVEDNPINLAVALHMLEALGHTVTAAGTGREALQAVAREV